MTRNFKIVLSLVIIAVLLIVGFIVYRQSSEKQGTDVTQNQDTYTNTAPNFSFSFPKGLKQSLIPEEGGGTVLVQPEDGRAGAQVYFTLFDEDISLTEERIRTDVPELNMRSVSAITLAGASAVSFENVDDGTFEVWSVRGGYLYQIVSFGEGKTLAEEIVKSWEW